ncbi:hypothetical protein KFZ70_02475 [Tamlana fucoidanivorans]|uniref:Uncharacterized protein n=1 Tax=Allotamlana fucoidanivorans TaxID=2583814 RepID=A0A5C4SD19_9FLAO|nr:hypothetical protein [Tamlana fucoidanivorans]TNJ40849.1 hypothetical protein FGF67_16740 [Tamlana fucoidanivorans]
MTLTNKFQIDRTIQTKKSESELSESLKKFDCKKMVFVNQKILISGKVFYDFICDLNIPEVKLTVKPKRTLLIAVLIFLTLWTIGFIYQNGILIGLPLTTAFIVFGAYVHKRMMELNLDEIIELIEKE